MNVAAVMIGAGSLALALATAAAAGNITLLRRVTLPSRPKLITLRLDDGVVALERTDATLLEGTFGIWVNDGHGHVRVGELLDSGTEGLVRRRVISTFGDVGRPTRGRWSGHAFPHASAVGGAFRDVIIESAAGNRDAWLFPGSAERWAIHIHGFKSMRASALRSVPAFTTAGFTSLVPAYYGESPAGHRNTREGATFGEAEAIDVEAAVSFAVAQGAEEIVLVGWSLGAEVALTIAQSEKHGPKIAGTVLIGPTLNWRWSLDQGMRAKSLPKWVRRGVLRSLESPIWYRFARMAVPARFGAHEWVADGPRPRVPALIIHSPGDADTSFQDSRRFAARSPESVDLVEFAPVPHLLEWNTQPSLFDASIVEWADRLTRGSAVSQL